MDETTLLLSLARFASAVARLNLGHMMPLLTVHLAITNTRKPGLLSAYSSGYILTQIAGGYLADKYGDTTVVTGTVGISSMMMLLVTHFTSAEVWTQLFFCLGLVAGPLFPAGSAAISTNVQPDKRAASAAIVDSAAALGTTVAALAPIVAERYGWRSIYYLTSTALALVAAGCWSQTTTRAKVSSRQQQKSNNYHNVALAPVEKYPLQTLLSPAVLATFACHSVDNFTKYSINAWAATMLTLQHQASSNIVGSVLATQEAVGVASRLLVGLYGQQQQTPSSGFGRSGLVSAVAFALQGSLLCLAFCTPKLSLAGILLVCSNLAVGGHSIGFRLVYLEVAPEHAGMLLWQYSRVSC